jgi:hypothetical protein
MRIGDYPEKRCSNCGGWYDEEAFFRKNSHICNGCEREEISERHGWLAALWYFIRSFFVR